MQYARDYPFRVVTNRKWLSAYLGGIHDWGTDIDPDTALQTYWRASGQWMARALRTGVDIPVTSCGPYWLERLPWKYRPWHVEVVPIEDVKCTLFRRLDGEAHTGAGMVVCS